jgi:hypothetical protein
MHTISTWFRHKKYCLANFNYQQPHSVGGKKNKQNQTPPDKSGSFLPGTKADRAQEEKIDFSTIFLLRRHRFAHSSKSDIASSTEPTLRKSPHFFPTYLAESLPHLCCFYSG